MLPSRHETVIAVFEDPRQAKEALLQLRIAGFGSSHLGLVNADHHHADESSYAGEEAAVGPSAGWMWGMGAATETLPAIAPAIAGGAGLALSSTGAGASAASLVGALLGIGVSPAEADIFEHALEDGHTVITVEAGDRDVVAMAILKQCGAERVERYHAEAEPSISSSTKPRSEFANSQPRGPEDAVAGSE